MHYIIICALVVHFNLNVAVRELCVGYKPVHYIIRGIAPYTQALHNKGHSALRSGAMLPASIGLVRRWGCPVLCVTDV